MNESWQRTGPNSRRQSPSWQSPTSALHKNGITGSNADIRYHSSSTWIAWTLGVLNNPQKGRSFKRVGKWIKSGTNTHNRTCSQVQWIKKLEKLGFTFSSACTCYICGHHLSLFFPSHFILTDTELRTQYAFYLMPPCYACSFALNALGSPF